MKKIIILLISLHSILLFGQSPNYPFPNHTVYLGTHIKPNNYTQTDLDNHLKSFYDGWKSLYLKNDCVSNEYYVFVGSGKINVSEAQGYGMMISAYFAGYDVNAQTYFDGLYRFYKSHPSRVNSSLMDWKQVTCNDTASTDDNSATDGDLDIAFGLLLAHSQWGSDGSINYLAEALIIINAIKQDDINSTTWTTKLGDWSNASNSNYFYGTRPSDFIIDHFRTFFNFTNDTDWNNVITTCYDLIEGIQSNYSTSTGLIPDFIINTNTAAIPAGEYYLESSYDGDYYYNSFRVPWRLGTDYLISGDTRAKTAINKINSWLLSTTSGNVDNISNGYKLNGTKIYSWRDPTAVGPFTIGAMLDTNNQVWLNNLYEDLITTFNIENGDYYSNTIKLLSMITISGNYWIPENTALSTNQTNSIFENFVIYPNITEGFINIEMNDDMSSQKVICKIIDVNGRVVTKLNLTENNKQLVDISTFKSGVYFISVIVNNIDRITKKIIKK